MVPLKSEKNSESDNKNESSDKQPLFGGFKRIWYAFLYSMDGLGAVWKHEAAFRQELLLTLVLFPFAVFMPCSLLGKAILIGSLFLVLIVELLNSGLEWVVDYISKERHPLGKGIKDMGSAAVFLSLLNAGIMWALIVAQSWSAIMGKIE